MKPTVCWLEEIKLVGITASTTNQNELTPELAKIPGCYTRYFQRGMAEKIHERKNAGITYCAYTKYESDHTGFYTFFIGEAVTIFGQIPSDMETLTIPSQNYMKFTTEAGSMPGIVISAWQKIWQIADFGAPRSYITDFEVYDEQGRDPNNAIVNIYIGLKG